MYTPLECLPFSTAFDLSKSSQESHILIVTSLMNLNVKKRTLINVIEPHSIVQFLKRKLIYHFVGALEYDLVSRYQNEPHVTREIALGQTSGKKKVLNNWKLTYIWFLLQEKLFQQKFFVVLHYVRKSLKQNHLELSVFELVHFWPLSVRERRQKRTNRESHEWQTCDNHQGHQGCCTVSVFTHSLRSCLPSPLACLECSFLSLWTCTCIKVFNPKAIF